MSGRKDSRIEVHNVEFDIPIAEPVDRYSADEVGPGKVVTLHFALMLENGEPIDSNFGKSPVSFTVGDGSLLPGFEKALLGQKAGATNEILILPDAAFGQINEDNIQRFPTYQFPPDLGLEAGLVINFADSAGNNQAGVVKQFDIAWVEVDFNHPLAGRSIKFRFHIHAVQQSQTSNVQ
jgi:FKBP-type peptidyl-prolyl cis-trans isomerase SlpA